MWETAQHVSGYVDYGVSTSYETSVSSQPIAAPAAVVKNGRDTPAILHEVRLTNLQPDTRYHYRVRTDDVVSADFTFRTHPANGRTTDSFRFVHTSNPNALAQREAKRNFSSISRYQPDFVVVSGDLSNHSTNDDYRSLFTHSAPFLSKTVMYACRGNHDNRKWSRFDYWFHNNLPASWSETYYSFDIGPAHFICINDHISRRNFPIDWFEKTMKNSSANWNIIFMNGNFRKRPWMQDIIERNKDHIDVILTAGKNHFQSSNGIWYLLSGGKTYSYHGIEMTPKSLNVTLFESTGMVIKTTMITKPMPNTSSKTTP